MDFSLLNREQYQAATFNGKHLLVLAGAGTGKTRTIIARAAYLIQKGEDPKRIKILSFTKKSANEIVSRIQIESSDNPRAKDLSGSTFHSWCMELIYKFPQIFHLEGYTCMDDDDQEAAMKLAMGHVYGLKKIIIGEERISPQTVLEIYSYSINTKRNLSDSIRIKCNLWGDSPDVVALVSKIREISEPIIRAYIEYKRTHKYIDYDDMLNIVALSLKKNSLFQDKVASQYSHILVDEAQDTNPLQWMLLENFFAKCHIFCVGDDAQSIYSFRGADFKSIHSFLDRVPEGQIIKLNQNYRSYQEILDLSNWMLNCSPLKYEKDLQAVRGHGGKPEVFYLKNDWEEAEVITGLIQKAYFNGSPYREHMILGRTAWSLREVEAACIKKHIPYSFFGGTGLMKSAHIRDLVSALRIIANYKDELAWMRYLTLWKGIGEVKASQIIDVAIEEPTLEDSISAIIPGISSCPEAYNTLQDLSNLHLSPQIAIDVALNHLEPRLKIKYDNWDYRLKDFSVLKMVASVCEDIASFINEFVLDPSAANTIKDKDGGPNDVITISTIHSAKGLESVSCYLVGVHPQAYPSPRACTEDEIEEERRCLYVALTRAKDNLYIMSRRQSVTVENVSSYYKHKTDNSLSGLLLSVRNDLQLSEEGRPFILRLYYIKTETNKVLSFAQSDFLENYIVVQPEDDLNTRYFFNGLPDELIEKKSLDEKTALTSPTKNSDKSLLGESPSIGDDFDFS